MAETFRHKKRPFLTKKAYEPTEKKLQVIRLSPTPRTAVKRIIGKGEEPENELSRLIKNMEDMFK